MFKFLFFLLIVSNAEASTHLFMIGGGARPLDAMNQFIQASGSERAKIAICSWASATTEGAQNISKELQMFHPASVEILPTFPMSADDEAKVKNTLHSVNGIFFTGGNQNQLMQAIQTLKLKEELHQLFQSGVSVAGTSAGTAIMSERMITGDDGALSEGLGLLPERFIVDQHFIVRNRFQRMINVLLSQTAETIGLGIDEGTSLYVEDGSKAKVIGPSETVVFQKENAKKVSVQFRSSGEEFFL